MATKKELVSAGMWPALAESVGGSFEVGITAAGTTQATGYQLTKVKSVVATTGAGTGVVLPLGLSAGDSVFCKNNGANALLVYPPLGGTINGGTANAALSVAAGVGAHIFCADHGQTFHSLD